MVEVVPANPRRKRVTFPAERSRLFPPFLPGPDAERIMASRTVPPGPNTAVLLAVGMPLYRRPHPYLLDLAHWTQRRPVVLSWIRLATAATKVTVVIVEETATPLPNARIARRVVAPEKGSMPSDRFDDDRLRRSLVGRRRTRFSHLNYPRRNYDRDNVHRSSIILPSSPMNRPHYGC